MSLVNEDDPRLVDVSRGYEKMQKQKQLLDDYYRGLGCETERVLWETWATKDFYYDSIAQVRVERWCRGRVVLLGDAGLVLGIFRLRCLNDR